MKVRKNGRNYVDFNGGIIDENARRLARNTGSPISAVVCPECGCEYEYSPADVQSQAYIGDVKVKAYGYRHYVCCPECGKRYPCGSTLECDFPSFFGEKFIEEHKDCMVREWNGETYGGVDWKDDD